MKRSTSQNVLLEHVHKKEDMALWCAKHVNAGDLKLLLDDYATTYTRKQFQSFLRRVHSAVMYLADATSSNSLRHHLTAVNVIDTLVDIVESTIQSTIETINRISKHETPRLFLWSTREMAVSRLYHHRKDQQGGMSKFCGSVRPS